MKIGRYRRSDSDNDPQPGSSSAHPIFSRKLPVDNDLILSRKIFEQSLEKLIKGNELSDTEQLNSVSTHPTPYDFAQFAEKVYRDYKQNEYERDYEERLKLPPDWMLLTTAKNNANGYFGAAYWHLKRQQVVIAHRGTDITSLKDLEADIAIVFGKYTNQMSSASTFAEKVRAVLNRLNGQHKINFQLFFTGHSLGGWLAQITTFTTEYLYLNEEKGLFLGNNNAEAGYHAHTLVFDSPGCKEMLEDMENSFYPRYDDHSFSFVDLKTLDITSYLSAPNRINTCKKHLKGTIYRVFTDLSQPPSDWRLVKGWRELVSLLEKETLVYNLATHRMDKILEFFNPSTKVNKDKPDKLKTLVIRDWLSSGFFRRGEEYKDFFKQTDHSKDYHIEITEENMFDGYCLTRYQATPFDERASSLRVFTQSEQQFLETYQLLRNIKLSDFYDFSNDKDIKDQANDRLRTFRIEGNTIHCNSVEELRTLIPYVQLLLKLFPKIKEETEAIVTKTAAKKMYQLATTQYLTGIEKKPLDFNGDPLALKTFLANNDQQIWQQKFGGKAWVVLKRVYRALQKTSEKPDYTNEWYYTVLKLKRLLEINKLVSVKTLLASQEERPHLLMIECDPNDDHQAAKALFEDSFTTVLQTNFKIKVVLITQPSDNLSEFFRKESLQTLGHNQCTAPEVTWDELKPESKQTLLETPVKFQGKDIPLNQLITATQKQLLNIISPEKLIEKEPLVIGKELQIPSDYDEDYYVGRTFNQMAIKEDIFKAEQEQKFPDLLTYTEKKFKSLCQQHSERNIHWLERESGGRVIWQQSQGSLATLRGYIDTSHMHAYLPKNLDDFLQQAQRHKVMLISDTAGMGKSTVLTHFSKQIKQKFPTHWVVRIDLNNHTNALDKQKKEQKNFTPDSAVKFLYEELLELNTPLEKKLFEQCFQQDGKVKVVLLLDGFDEISPHYKETIIDLLQVLKKTPVEQLWVTTRPHMKKALEDKLQQLSYTLKPFSPENQISFLTRFWKKKLNLPETSQQRLDIYAEALIKKMAESISDEENEFTGIPLQTWMLADVYKGKVEEFCQFDQSTPELPKKFDLMDLYGKFLDTKFDIFLKKGPIAANEQRSILKDGINLREIHQRLGLQVLFTKEQVDFLQLESIKLSKEKLARIGIARTNDKNKLQFVHRTFAEYYAAEFLVNQLKEQNQRPEVQDFFLKEILLRKDYNVIRAFLNGQLERNSPPLSTLTEYGKRIAKLRSAGDWFKWFKRKRNNKDKTFLHVAAEEGDANIISFLLDSLKVKKYTETLKDLLVGKNRYGETAWQLASEKGQVAILEKLWAWGKEAELSQKKLKNELLFVKDKHGQTAFYQAAKRGQVAMLEKLWAWGKEAKLSTEEFKDLLFAINKYGQTAFHLAAQEGHVVVLDKLSAWGKEAKLSTEEFKDLLFAINKYGQTAFHLAAQEGHVVVLDKLSAWGKEAKLSTEESKNLLLAKDNYGGQTAFHLAAEKDQVAMLEKLWAWGKEAKLSTEEFKDLLFAKNKYGQTAWYRAAQEGHVAVLDKLWAWGEEAEISQKELKNELLLVKDKHGQTAFHLAAERGQVAMLEKLLACGKEAKLSTEEFKDLFLTKNNYRGQTAWYRAAQEGHVVVLDKLWACGKEAELSQKELKNELLLAKDKYGQTAFHLAVVLGQVAMLEKLWACGKEAELSAEEFKNELLLARGNCGQTAFHLAAESGQVAMLEKLWAWGKEAELSAEEFKNELLLARDNCGQTAFHLAANSGQVAMLEKLWACGKEAKLSTEEFKDLLFAINEYGQTAFHLAAQEGHVVVLDKLSAWGKEAKLSTEESKNLLLAKDNYSGQTAFHLAAEKDQVAMLEKLWAWGKEAKLSTEEFKDLLFAKNDNGKTAFHLAAKKCQVAMLEKLWACGKEAELSQKELKNELLLAQDKYGQTAFHLAAESGQVAMLENLWAWGKEAKLSTKESKDLLLARDNYGQTAFYLAAESGQVAMLEKLWAWGKEAKLSTKESKDLLLAINKYGQTAFHLAAKEGQVAMLEKLWAWGKEAKLSAEESYNLCLPKIGMAEPRST